MNTPTYSYAYKYAAFDGLRRLVRRKQEARVRWNPLARQEVTMSRRNEIQVEPTTNSTRRENTRQAKRRFSVYWTWSYPWEANRDVTEMDNRFSTMTEVRRVAWPEL